jgi:hypothetical protein
MDFEMIKQKIPHGLIVVGTLLIFFRSLKIFEQYLFLDRLISIGGTIDNLFFQSFFNSILTDWAGGILGLAVISVLGLILSGVLVFYFVRILQSPTRKDFIVITFLGVAGILISSGIGGILILVAGFLGIKKYSQSM